MSNHREEDAEMKEIEITMDTEEIGEFVYKRLVEEGMAPTANEVDILSHIFFDFLIEKSVIRENDEE